MPTNSTSTTKHKVLHAQRPSSTAAPDEHHVKNDQRKTILPHSIKSIHEAMARTILSLRVCPKA